MSTTPSFDLEIKTSACIKWNLNDATRYLIDPDPQRDSVKLDVCFSSQSSVASFQLRCRIRVKGIESYSNITSLIKIRSKATLKYDENPEIPDIMPKELNCKAVCFSVIDALRSLAKATAINIYISARETSLPRLSAVYEPVSQNRLQSIHTDTSTHLASLNGGKGGKIISFSSKNYTSTSRKMHKLTKRVEQFEREELDELRASCEKATDATDANETALLKVHNDINDLRIQVDFLAQGRLNSNIEEHIIKMIKESVLTHILETKYNAKIVMEKA
ncbi:hypothetical protein ACQKWADRAFT_324344 [Trichoderma austrokoningii]